MCVSLISYNSRFYRGSNNATCRALALCDVAGGPEYELPLEAAVSFRYFVLCVSLISYNSLFCRGSNNATCRALALCDVAGGPEYELPLLAESSAIAYKLDKTLLDFGLQNYDHIEEKEVFIFNTGRVELDFEVVLSELSRTNVIEVPAGFSLGLKHTTQTHTLSHARAGRARTHTLGLKVPCAPK